MDVAIIRLLYHWLSNLKSTCRLQPPLVFKSYTAHTTCNCSQNTVQYLYSIVGFEFSFSVCYLNFLYKDYNFAHENKALLIQYFLMNKGSQSRLIMSEVSFTLGILFIKSSSLGWLWVLCCNEAAAGIEMWQKYQSECKIKPLNLFWIWWLC